MLCVWRVCCLISRISYTSHQSSYAVVSALTLHASCLVITPQSELGFSLGKAAYVIGGSCGVAVLSCVLWIGSLKLFPRASTVLYFFMYIAVTVVAGYVAHRFQDLNYIWYSVFFYIFGMYPIQALAARP